MENILRREVKEAERHTSSIKDILARCPDITGFIGLYLRRNPTKKHPEFLDFYDDLDISSQVLLYEKKKKMIKNDKFEEECLMSYCIEQRSEISYDIIKAMSSSKILFKTLSTVFLSVSIGEEDDFFFTKCIVLALRTHDIDSDEVKVLMSGIAHHFSDGRRKYYEHGAIVASVLLNTNEFDIESMNEAQRMIEDIPEHVLKKDTKKNFENPNDVFKCYRKVENDLGILETSWRPKYFQEAVKLIEDERETEKIEACFRWFPNLVENATERMLKHKSKEAFKVLMNYDGREEHKVDAVSSLIQRSYKFLIDDVMNDFFDGSLCLRQKIILAFSFRKIIREGPLEQAVPLYRGIKFMARRIQHEIPKVMGRALECLLIEGVERIQEGKNGSESLMNN
ncbi:hypothetical protein EHEL_071560 [Encephalitozoon hellem ATCC 50504]|uniref:Uncharacterized protein n=1 Tax=Encephalitozoon hellem TaxID=27973 RepID=A0A9Q9F9Y0_ENCHE|nr:uncharacterized protein EHEL_071560 [Encephalitozoon hellem ATCC 50504]AFM98678.1 hypothetical protein EHEL_071560 [Encephalitozoon hellem ATCC 50504]UTX43627.1 hypothetical protein GPU96_07g13910 [Encephalitozoon hellem]|eukprot:XP_003887659.1 hypothetical protein EHEL_071560 [Encephalitozoon hellem ATCC 50504]